LEYHHQGILRQDQGGARVKKLAKAVYLALKFKKPPPFELVRWSMAERFGWTLDYIDSLSIDDLFEFYEVEEGRNKAMPQSKSRGKK
jgi:hypothetical protein